MNITFDSYSITPHLKKNRRKEDVQEYRMIPFNKNVWQEDHKIPLNENESNKSIIAIKTIEPI